MQIIIRTLKRLGLSSACGLVAAAMFYLNSVEIKQNAGYMDAFEFLGVGFAFGSCVFFISIFIKD